MTPEHRNTIDDATHDEWVAASQNMKIEISREWAEKSAKIEGDAAVGAGLPSALGLPKLAAQPSALDLATGSDEVASAIVEDQECAADLYQAARTLMRYRDVPECWTNLQNAAMRWNAAMQARRNAELTKSHQPHQNASHQP